LPLAVGQTGWDRTAYIYRVKQVKDRYIVIASLKKWQNSSADVPKFNNYHMSSVPQQIQYTPWRFAGCS